MTRIATTKLSSKGQVVIPETIREQLGLHTGTQFVVVGNRDCVILKTVSPPPLEELDELLAEAKHQAKQAGLTPARLRALIAKVRARS